LSVENCWNISQSLRQSDLANEGFGFILQPEAELRHILFRQLSCSFWPLNVLVAEIFGNFFVARLNVDECEALERANLLKDHLVDLVANDQDWNIALLEWTHERIAHNVVFLLCRDKVDLFLPFGHRFDIVFKTDASI